MMLYYRTKSGSKWANSLEDITEIAHSEPIFLHDTLAYDAA